MGCWVARLLGCWWLRVGRVLLWGPRLMVPGLQIKTRPTRAENGIDIAATAGSLGRGVGAECAYFPRGAASFNSP